VTGGTISRTLRQGTEGVGWGEILGAMQSSDGEKANVIKPSHRILQVRKTFRDIEWEGALWSGVK